VGLCFEVTLRTGTRVGVVTQKSGRRELLIYEADDPDTAHEVFTADADEAHTIAELLGGTTVTQHVADLFQTAVEGVNIAWVQCPQGWYAAGRVLGQAELRTRSGVSIIAIVRGQETIPSPGPAELIKAGDTLVLIGTPDGLRRAEEILEHGPT
jgi:TrkA domain protein